MAMLLVIDDEKNIRMMVQLALEQVGHTVELAADGPEGLEKFGDGSKIDLVLLDQRMPGMEGLDVLREIRKRSPDSKVIMITAFGTIDLAVDAMKAGATDFLRKPFDAETLRNAVKSALIETAVTQPAPAAQPSGALITYWSATLNGYSISSRPRAGVWQDGDLSYAFEIRNPDGQIQPCTVLIRAGVMDQIKDRLGNREFPGGESFARNLCSHVMAEYIWQNSDLPSENSVEVATLTKELARWIDSLPAY
ncbi:MAG TPA: response regulator [Armatimonadota bacterium]